MRPLHCDHEVFYKDTEHAASVIVNARSTLLDYTENRSVMLAVSPNKLTHSLLGICMLKPSALELTMQKFEELLVPHLHRDPLVSCSAQLDQRLHDPCVACGCGDNSISHWSRFCVVPLLVLNYFCAETQVYTNMAQSVNNGDYAIAVASVVLHQFRRLLLERGGMVHTQDARDLVTWNTQNWIDTLGELVHQALPAHMCCRSWYQLHASHTDTTSKCCEHTRFLQCTHTDPLHLLALSQADKIVGVKDTIAKGATLAVLPAGHSILKLLHLQANAQAPNAVLVRVDCRCTVPHFRLESIDELIPNDLVNIGCGPQHITQPFLLCQFDGSCHHSYQIGGAGCCIFLVCHDSVQLLRRRAIGLHQCLDNVVAEVKACRFLIEEIVDVCTHEYASLDLRQSPIIVQGDILPVIKYLEYAGRLRRLDLSCRLGIYTNYRVSHASTHSVAIPAKRSECR